VGLHNPAFDGIKIKDSDEKPAHLLDKMSRLVEETMVVTEDPTVAGISQFVDEHDAEEGGLIDHREHENCGCEGVTNAETRNGEVNIGNTVG